jgi:transcriptional regulator with XRE-family HTH domain
MDKRKISGARIKSVRKEQKITQKDFGEAVSIYQGQISRIEAGTAEPTSQQILQIAQFLGKTTSYLLGEDIKKEVMMNTDGFTEGLKAIVEDVTLINTLSIEEEEIRELSSLQSKKNLSKAAYIQMLFVIRQA